VDVNWLYCCCCCCCCQVSIPLSVMGSCWAKLLDVIYQGDLEGTNATIR
jgi:hypothetical protein